MRTRITLVRGQPAAPAVIVLHISALSTLAAGLALDQVSVFDGVVESASGLPGVDSQGTIRARRWMSASLTCVVRRLCSLALCP